MVDKKSDLAAHLSEERYRLLVNAVTDYAIYMLDSEGRISTWNPGAQRFKGYAEDEIIGEHFSRFYTDEDRAAGVPRRALETAATAGRFEAEGWRVRKDGSLFWAHVVIDPVRDDAGQLVGFAKITRDVSERKEAERALRASEQQFRLLMRGVKDYAIYMIDTTGIVTNWNAGAAAIKGYSAAEIVGAHFSRFYTDEEQAAGEPQRALETALREGKYEREAWRVRKDGSLFWANVLIDPIFDEAGEHVGFAKVTRDATERKKAQEELETARAELAQAQKLQALGELTGGIAHDFNNLMTVISGAAELLQRGKVDDIKRRRYLQAIIDTAQRAATLTSHLLAFGRRQPLRPQVLDLTMTVDAMSEMLTRTLGSHIQVEVDLAPQLWKVEVDPAQLETAVLNAAFNARDAMPDGGCLTISTRNHQDAAGDLVCVAIADTGTGMPEEVISRAFEPFFTTKPVGKGTGLGLSQIHGFAAQTGGRAEIQSTAGKGTTIRILLPRTLKQSAAEEVETGEVQLPPVTVLLVDDNDQVREFADHLLTDLGCTVIGASDAIEALEMLKDQPIDLLFTDVVMPGMSGVELARMAAETYPAMPILLASGYSEEIVSSALEFGLVRKPYGRESLRTALAGALAGHCRKAAVA